MHKKEITGIVHKISGENSYTILVQIIKKIKRLHLQKLKYIKIMIHSDTKLEVGQKVNVIKCAPISKKKHYIFKEFR